MGKLYRGTCKNCREDFAARSPSALLSKMSKHRWKKHSNWMSRRIKAGKAAEFENPTIQDFIAALQENVRASIVLYRGMSDRQYRAVKEALDALEPVLPVKMVIAWKAVEAIHDIRLEGLKQ